MNLFSTDNDHEHEDGYWLALNNAITSSGDLPMHNFHAKLNGALQDLGRLDYSLTSSLDRLRCDLTTETHDHLHGQVSAMIEPELKAAIANLADAIGKAKALVEEFAVDDTSRRN